MTEAPFDIQRAHRWFAVEYNNQAWEIVESKARSADDTERMIHAAHAARVHWLEVGTPVNHVRAECLLATAYAVAKLAEAAVWYAERCLALCSTAGDELTPFDRASAFGCAANAYACARNFERARTFRQQTAQAMAEIDGVEEKELLMRLYPTR